MDEAANVSLIHGRRFLASEKAMINMETGEFKLSFNGEDVTFSLYNSKNAPNKEKCRSIQTLKFFVEVGEMAKNEKSPRVALKDPRRCEEKWEFM
ncbi:hypothetical protein ACS0TY_026745 [Phlomoides rotata]